MKKSICLALGAAGLAVLTACAGPVGTPGNPSPSFTPGPNSSPNIKDVCGQVNTALQAAAYYQQGQPPASQEQLDNMADQLEKAIPNAPQSQQAQLQQMVSGLRVLATTPPDQRANSAQVQAFVKSMNELGLACNAVAAPINTPSGFPGLESSSPSKK